MLSRRRFLASTASVAAVAAVGLPALAAESGWYIRTPWIQIPGGIEKRKGLPLHAPHFDGKTTMKASPGWQWRTAPGGELIHEPIPGGLA